MSRLISLEEVMAREELQTYIEHADRNMEAIGYTEHGLRHARLAAGRARLLLESVGRSEREAELAGIAAYLHDMGNVAGREFHPVVGCLIAFEVFREMGMPPAEVAEVMAGIANHDEETGEPYGAVAAAVIIADKSDVSRSRVRSIDPSRFDEHDRINYAAISSSLEVDVGGKTILLKLVIDTEIGSIMEYFELFLSRMVISRRAAQVLGYHFSLIINGTKLL
jgi:hypothetical protein